MIVPAASAAKESPARPEARPSQVAPRSGCPYAHVGLQYYRGRFVHWTLQRGASIPDWRGPRNCADAKYLAAVWERRARVSHRVTIVHIKQEQARTLRDFVHSDGSHAWARAVREVQRAYPGTESWLMSCSASEGGWGRWVPNSGGSGVGGWMQMYPSTFWRMFSAAKADATSRGFIIPASAASWYSTLGQALGSAWGMTHGRRGEWSGGGC